MNPKVQIRLALMLLLLSAVAGSCKKNDNAPSTSPTNVYIIQAGLTDTLSRTISTIQDTIVTIKLEAAARTVLNGTHTIVLAVDTSQMIAYRAKYGNALTLPLVNYVLPFYVSTITGGVTTGTSAELNIVKESILQPGTTYVLPVVIKSVDGQAPSTLSAGQVTYIIVKTPPIDYGVPVDETGWQIVSYSSQYDDATYAASNVLTNDPTTYWFAFDVPMPQNVVIDMRKEYRLKAVTFLNSILYTYGGNPTQIEIELSQDGVTWTNMGNFPGGTPGSTTHQLLMKPITPARYIRFTVLESSLYFGFYSAVAIAEIGANN